MNGSAELIIEKINSAKKIAVFCHFRPDGDALGAGLAVYLMLRNAGKQVCMCCEDEPPEKFRYIPAVNEVKTQLPDGEYDCFISVDCADINRLGIFQKRYSNFKGVTVNIDHHISNIGYAKYNYVIDCPASCEIITGLFIKAGWQMTEEIAYVLMLGLITDSGNFTHRDVTAKTYETAAYLRGYGADITEINYKMYSSQTKNRALLYGRVMNKMRFALNDRLVFLIVSAEDMKATGTDKSATEGFVDFPLTIDGVEVSVSLMEFKNNQYKASLRSKSANVNAVASVFGGGGHILASGCMVFGSIEEVIEKLTYAVFQNL